MEVTVSCGAVLNPVKGGGQANEQVPSPKEPFTFASFMRKRLFSSQQEA